MGHSISPSFVLTPDGKHLPPDSSRFQAGRPDAGGYI